MASSECVYTHSKTPCWDFIPNPVKLRTARPRGRAILSAALPCGRLFYPPRRLQRLQRLNWQCSGYRCNCRKRRAFRFRDYNSAGQPDAPTFMPGQALVFHIILVQQPTRIHVQMPRQPVDRHIRAQRERQLRGASLPMTAAVLNQFSHRLKHRVGRFFQSSVSALSRFHTRLSLSFTICSR